MNPLFLATALQLEASIEAEEEACTTCVARMWPDMPTAEWIERMHKAKRHAQRWRLMNDLFEHLLANNSPAAQPCACNLSAALIHLEVIDEAGGRA